MQFLPFISKGFLIACSLCWLTACGADTAKTAAATAEETLTELAANPAAPGFNFLASDSLAIALADQVVVAHGGRKAYDQNRYFSWNFFGLRTLIWDKQAARVRIDFPSKQAIYLLNYETMEGQVQLQGQAVTQPDSLTKYLKEAHSIWINDSYWLVHQFKLKDSGVTLKMAEDSPADPSLQRPSYVIDQTFSEVGDTPQNRYRLFIDRENYRINTWQFFRQASDSEPSISTPWSAYATYNGLLLSTDRGSRFQLQEVSTPSEVAETVFTQF